MRCGKGGGKFQERQKMERIPSTRYQSRDTSGFRSSLVRVRRWWENSNPARHDTRHAEIQDEDHFQGHDDDEQNLPARNKRMQFLFEKGSVKEVWAMHVGWLLLSRVSAERLEGA